MAPQFQMETTGKSCLTQEQSSERQIPAGLPLPSTAQGQELSISRCRKGSEGISQRKGTCWDGLLPACIFSSFKRIYFNHTTDSQARGGRQRLSPSQQLWKTPINNPTNTNCMRFPFLHSPARTQEKSILQLQSNKTFRNRHRIWVLQPPLP